MDTSVALDCARHGDSQPSLLSIPDMELLDEITDGDVQELLHLMSLTGRDAEAAISTGSAPHPHPLATSRSFYGHTELPLPYPTHSAPLFGSGSDSSNNSGSGDAGQGRPSANSSVGTAAPHRSAARRDPARHATTAEFEGVPPPTTGAAAQRSARPSAASASPPPLPVRLQHVSDTALLSAEPRRWGQQLVQECWTHQELHNVRWDEQRLLRHGAAYRPRAIASRTAVKMTHTKSLCIALNVDPAIIENAGESQVEDYTDEGSAGDARMPSLCSPEAEGWSPLLMWRSPALTPGDAPTVLTQLSECLGEQYEGLAPRPLPTSCCANARPSDLVQTLSDARKDAGDAKVIFHYLARGVPPPRGGNLYLMNANSAASGYAGPPYSKLSLDTFRSRVGSPLVFIADCAEARDIMHYYIRMCEEQHQQRYFTSSREYQLKSSRQVSAAELDSLAEGAMGSGIGGGAFDRAGSGADLSGADGLRRGRAAGGGDGGTPPPQSAILQDFYFIGATGSSSSSSGGMGGGGSGGPAGGGLRDRAVSGYDEFAASSTNLLRGAGSGGGGGAAVGGGSSYGALRHHVRLPSDILTSCLTTPLRMALLWFIAERPELQELHPLLLRLLPGSLTDKKTPLGQLQWYLQSIIECIAWSTLSLPEYSRLFREDVYVAPLFRGYVLAERIIVGGLDGCLSVYPPVAATHTHPLWATWDNLVERACVALLRAVHPAPPRCLSVMEFRGWLDETVTSWKYTRPDLIATAAVADGRSGARLPSTPDECLVLMPSFFSESLRGMQAQLDGITQQSFERPRVFFADTIGLQLAAAPAIPVWDAAWPTAANSGEAWEAARRQQRHSARRRAGANAGGDGHGEGPGEAKDAGSPLLLLRDAAEQYANTLRSSYPPVRHQQPPLASDGAAFSQDGTRAGVSAAASVGDFLSGSNTSGGARASQPASAQASSRAEGGRAGMPSGRYLRTSEANLVGRSAAASPAASITGSHARPTPAAAVVARMDARRSPSRAGGRRAEYVANLFTNATASGQANSFHYAAGLHPPGGGSGDAVGGSASSPPALSGAIAPPFAQHTFPFMDRMPLLLQALLVAAHREKATELVCRLVDCGPAAVLQCAEANIYRFVLDRYWSRPDLRFLMPATLFIYCKSCYADPELIGNAKQRDAAVKACAEVLQSPVEVPQPAAPGAAAAGEDAGGAWQSAVLGPYATPYGQRMLAAALLTLIALHSDDGRQACHQHGVFQLCCQLLHRTRDEAPLVAMSNLEMAHADGAAAVSGPPSHPPLPRPPSSTFSSNASCSSPLQAQSQAAASAAAAAAAMADEPPPPASVATTYHVTLLTLFVSLLCNWKPPASAEDDDGGDCGGPTRPLDAEAAAQELLSPLDGTVRELPPTTPQVLAAGLRLCSTVLLNFTYSDTSILRGAALRCLMMVLVSPAPSAASRTHFVEVELSRIHRETLQRCEANTDLRLEVLGMGYTTLRWLLEQLRQDLPLEEIGQYVSLWVYKWFKLSAQGKTPASPYIASGSRGAAADSAPSQHPPPRASAAFQPAPSSTAPWGQPLSMSYRGASVVMPGSVYSHRGSNVLVPAARSVYAGGFADGGGGGGGGAVAGSLANAMGLPGLRQHLTPQDHRRLQSCLPPLSNLVRLFFEHTQDACPYVRTYARRVVVEEFSFLRQSWYDDYAAHDGRATPEEDDYGTTSGHHHHHHRGRHRSRHRGYGGRHDSHAASVSGSGRAAPALTDPVTASSVDGGGDLATYLPLRAMLGRGEALDDPREDGTAARSAAEAHAGSAPGGSEIEDVPDPQPAVLRRFVARLLRIASATGQGTAGSLDEYATGVSQRHPGDSGSDDEGGGEGRGGGGGGGSRGRLEGGAGGRRGPSSGGEQRRRQHSGLDAQDTDELGGSGGDGTLLDSETMALHPLWAMDTASMTNFAYGALSFLERFMLEEMDDSDPRHPMNLEKENALHQYYQRVERNIHAFAQDEMSATGPAPDGGSDQYAAAADTHGAEVRDATAGRSSGNGATSASRFRCLGVGEVGRAGVLARASGRPRRRSQRSRGRDSSSYPRHDDGAPEMAEDSAGLRATGNVDVVLFHPSEPLVITSTTGGLLSVWSYDHLGLPPTENDEEAEGDGDAQAGEYDGKTAAGAVAPPRSLRATAQFFLRDVVGRSRSDLTSIARPRFMYDRFNPNTEYTAQQRSGGRWPQRADVDGRRGTRGRASARCPGNFYRRDEFGGGGAWMDRAEAANAIAALPSSYQHGHPHYYHGVGDLHLVDAAHHPLICAVRRFGAVEVFSHFADRHRVRRVATFETARFGQGEGVHECVSSYQPCTGLLYLSNGEGGVSAWDLGNEQRLATFATLAGVDAVSSVGGRGSVSALRASAYTPYEFLVGSYSKPVCLFDLRDGGGAARLGYAHPAVQCVFGGLAASSSAPSASPWRGGGARPLSSLCVRVSYSHRYPEAVVAGYACGTVAVWDRRYPRQPSLVFGAALDADGDGARTMAPALSATASTTLGDGGVSTMVRQLDVHSCSRRFLTLTTTPTVLQLAQPTRHAAGPAGGQRTTSVVESFELGGSAPGAGQSSEPGAACFHDFSPVMCVGAGSTVRLYGTPHLSTVASYVDADDA